jgi:hypothetical protein
MVVLTLVVYFLEVVFAGPAMPWNAGAPIALAGQPSRSLKVSMKPGQTLTFQANDTLIRWWCWQDCGSRVRQIWMEIPEGALKSSMEQRRKVTLSSWIRNSPNYGLMVDHDAPFYRPLARRLRQIAAQNGYNSSQAALMVVQMVQSIPYTLVHPHSHPEMEDRAMENNSSFVHKYHRNPRHTPLSKEPFGGCVAHADPSGVLSPLEFMHDFKGDCDTRTVFLYTLLKTMGLKALVVNGPGHSMLAVPYAPKTPGLPYLVFRGRKYYFVETTVLVRKKGYCGPGIGEVPRGFRTDQWRIVLN